MYFSYILYTNIHINTILKYTFQNGGNIIFYRNFLEKISDNKYIKKENTYIIFANIETINIINLNFKNRVKTIKYDVSKLKFLNLSNLLNFKIYRYDMIDNNQLEIIDKNSKIFLFFQDLIKENIIDTLKKVCTKYIPVNVDLTSYGDHIGFNILFDADIKLKYKYIIYMILKNKMISFLHSNEMNECYSFVIL